MSGEPAAGGEVPVVAVVVEEIGGEEGKDGDGEDPLDPGEADVKRRALGKVDSEEHEADRHDSLLEGVPEVGEVEQNAVWVLAVADEESDEVGEDAENEPGIWAARTRKDDPDSGEEEEERKEEKEAAEEPEVDGSRRSALRGEGDVGGANGRIARVRVRDAERLAYGAVADLGGEKDVSVEGMAVDGEDGVAGTQAGGECFRLRVGENGFEVAAEERSARHEMAMRENANIVGDPDVDLRERHE